MSFKIEHFLDAGAPDAEIRQQVISVHDDLLAAQKIVDSVADAFGVGANRSDDILLAVFHELRKYRS